MRVGTLLEERCSLWGREVERMLDWSWLVVRLRKLDLPDLTSGVLFSEGRLNWSWACLDGVLFPWGATGTIPCPGRENSSGAWAKRMQSQEWPCLETEKPGFGTGC